MTLDLRLAVDETAFGSTPVKIRCLNPNHEDPTNSLAVYPDNLHCFGCGWHRNDWDEALALLLGISKDEARNVAHRYDSDNVDAYREKATQQARRDPMPIERAKMYNRFLWQSRPERASWYFERGLTEATINQALLGHDGFRYTIPVFDRDGNLLTIRYRRDDAYCDEDMPKYSGTKGRNGLYVYGEIWLDGSTKVVLCEGELDALRLHQCGVLAVSATNGARQCRKLPVLLSEMFPNVRVVAVATDMDTPGEEAAIQTMEAAEGLGLEAIRLAWVDGSKDITEYLQNGGKLKELLKGRLVNGNIRYSLG